ncbi:hypothetical protein [Caenimonas koreensis]|uniref:hypothetical protein n=1 Tax=Caenimonas koreensis TaxID=367474 RepID=UPI003783BD6E
MASVNSADDLNGNETLKRGYAALGEYIALCSLVEVSLHICLKQWLGIEDSIERLLVGEPRMGDLIDLVKKASLRATICDERRVLLAKLCVIASENNKIRSIVAHKPLFAVPGPLGILSFSNAATAKTAESAYTYLCAPVALTNQAALLHECANALLMLGLIKEIPGQEVARVNAVLARLASLQSTHLPAIPNPPPPPKPPKQKRQRPPSPA